MLKELHCQAMRHRFEGRRNERSTRLTSLQALLKGEDVDPRTIEPLKRQYERMRLMRLNLAPPTEDIQTSRKLFEVVVGRDDRLPRQFLEGGSRTGNAVGRIIGLDTNINPFFGTAFSIAPGLILTNNHVLSTPEIAALSDVEFGYWTDQSGAQPNSLRVNLAPNDFFFTDVELDFTIVSLDQRFAKAVFDLFGVIDLLPNSGKSLIGESVNIIDHGGGDPQSIVIRNNTIVDVFDDWIHYTTDTLPGASGAPVLNDQWQLAALHHASIEHQTEDGQSVFVNEGIRISSICNKIRNGII